jgi:hypothetical protein
LTHEFPGRAFIFSDATTGLQAATIDLLVESPLPTSSFTWQEVARRRIPEEVRVAGWRTTAELSTGLGPEFPLTPGGSFDIKCYADGTCDARTLYLENTGVQSQERRVAVLPLNGIPVALGGW